MCVYTYIHTYMYMLSLVDMYYQFTIIYTCIVYVCCLRFVSDWTHPLDILSADSDVFCYYLSKQGAWTTQPLEQILDSEFLLCELGVLPASVKETLLRRGRPFGQLASKTPNQGLERRFCCWFAKPRLANKDLFVHRHR